MSWEAGTSSELTIRQSKGNQMGRTLLAILLLSGTSIIWADEKFVEIPFPPITIAGTAKRLYCDALIGTTLRGRTTNYPLVKSGMVKSGLTAKADKATDRVVIEIERDNLFLFERAEFENGKATRDFPAKYIQNTEDNVFAMTIGTNKTKGAGIVTVDLKTGIATWTTIYGRGPVSDVPAIVTMYLRCGPRKD